MATCVVEDGSDVIVGAVSSEDEPSRTRPGASEAFVRGMTNLVNTNDVERMVTHQQHMLTRFEKTNEMLLNFNHLSENRFATTQLEFRKHIQLLLNTKKDLENVFRRIRTVKDKLRLRYPEAFAVCAQVHHVPDDIEDENVEDKETLRLPAGDVTRPLDAAKNSTADVTRPLDAANNSISTIVSIEISEDAQDASDTLCNESCNDVTH